MEAGIQIGEITADGAPFIGGVVRRVVERQAGMDIAAEQAGNDRVAAKRAGRDTVDAALGAGYVLMESAGECGS